MPIPIDQRKKPTAVKIHVKTGAGVDITWADGHSSILSLRTCANSARVATCNDERGKKEVLTTMNLPSSPLLPMYKPKPRAQGATQVGNYAVQPQFHGRALHRNLQLRLPAHALPLRRMRACLSRNSQRKHSKKSFRQSPFAGLVSRKMGALESAGLTTHK